MIDFLVGFIPLTLILLLYSCLMISAIAPFEDESFLGLRGYKKIIPLILVLVALALIGWSMVWLKEVGLLKHPWI